MSLGKLQVDRISVHVDSHPGNVKLSRIDMTLSQIQCQLDKNGASDLVIDLVMTSNSRRVFLENIELGIALLEGGNSVIQVTSNFLIVNVIFLLLVYKAVFSLDICYLLLLSFVIGVVL